MSVGQTFETRNKTTRENRVKRKFAFELLLSLRSTWCRPPFFVRDQIAIAAGRRIIAHKAQQSIRRRFAGATRNDRKNDLPKRNVIIRIAPRLMRNVCRGSSYEPKWYRIGTATAFSFSFCRRRVRDDRGARENRRKRAFSRRVRRRQ